MNTGNRFRDLLISSLIVFTLFVGMMVINPYSGFGESDREERFSDFGLQVERVLTRLSKGLFGIKKPLDKSAPPTDGSYRSEGQDADDQVLLAKGLKAQYVTRNAGNKTDMMAFFPEENSTHLITCVEGGREEIGTDPDGSAKYNPSVQRINLSTGTIETVLRGMNRCDGIRTTAWGTILATEETSDGGAYEILDPLTTTEQTVIDRATGEITDPAHIAKRSSLPTMAWEGLTVLSTGVVIGGDEERPGTSGPDADGGAIFKFIPDSPYTGMLNDSPLVSGSVYAMQISCREAEFSKFPQYGQGCGVGQGTWVQVNAASARYEANLYGATGYYRPEDLHKDPMFRDINNQEAVRFCWTNTGREKAAHYGEIMCAIDSDPMNPGSLVVANRFLEGDTEFNSFDNLAFQPVTGNMYVIEDHKNGDIFACLPDGADRDIKSDGCVRLISVRDSSAEPTGFTFSNDGRTAYFSVQHSNDGLMSLYDDYPTDDVLRISGFKTKGEKEGLLDQ